MQYRLDICGTMQNFVCTGQACADSCCHSWHIIVSKEYYGHLKRKMDGSDEERKAFEAGLALNDINKMPDDPTEIGYARFVQQPLNGACTFQDPQGWCTVQSRYGEEMLSEVCASFPRRVNRFSDDHMELIGDPSCPEVARTLLFNENATTLSRHDYQEMPHFAKSVTITPKHAEGEMDLLAQGTFFQVRSGLVELLLDGALPLTSRLYLLAYLAEKLDAIHQQISTGTEGTKGENGSSEDDNPHNLGNQQGGNQHAGQGGYAVQLRASTIKQLSYLTESQERRREMHTLFSQITIQAPLAVNIITVILKAVRGSVQPAFLRLMEDVIRSYGGSLERLTPAGSAHLFESYQHRTAFWQQRVGSNLDTLLQRYAVNHLYFNQHTGSRTLSAYVQNLALRMALLRFLIMGHPLLDGMRARILKEQAEQDHSLSHTQREQFEKVVCEVVYLTSRTMEHNHEFIGQVENDMQKHKMQTLAHTCYLILF